MDYDIQEKRNLHRLCKVIALMLAITIFATLIPVHYAVYANMTGFNGNLNGPSEENRLSSGLPNATDDTVDALYEDVNLRTLNSKTLRQNDGTLKLGTYSFNIHFRSDKGLIEYDNSLLHKDGLYYPTASDCIVAFSDKKPEYSIKADKTDVAFSFLTDNQNAPKIETRELKEKEFSSKAEELFAVSKAKSQISYNYVDEGVSLVYVLFGANIKENIVLEKLPKDAFFKFYIKTESEVFIDKDGSIIIDNAVIPHAFMEDSAGNLSTDIKYVLEKAEDGYVLTIEPNRDWLDSSERAYPVTIDPTFYRDNPSTSAFKDAYVKEGNPSYNSGYDSLLHVGNDANNSSWLKERIYLKVNTLPALPASSRILNAYIALEQTANGQWYSFSPSSLSTYIVAKKVASSWSDTSVTWNNQPQIAEMSFDYSGVSASTAGKYTIIDITSCAQEWYEDPSSNYGIVLEALDENLNCHLSYSSVNDTSFTTTNPVYAVTYIDTKGLDGRWTFVTQDVGFAGTVNVNLYNGQPVITGPGLNTSDSILPLSVYPVYNGFQAGRQFSPNSNDINAPITRSFNAVAGYGFKLSCWESISYKNAGGDAQEHYYVYNDSDGTELYFRSYPGIGYVSEDGYDLKLTFSNSSDSYYVISDSSGNEKHFNNRGQISLICDEYGNQKIYNYDSNNRLTAISFKSASMDTAETQLSFTYTSAGAISRITASDSSIYISFSYSTGYNDATYQGNSGYLRKITLSDGNYAEYSYLPSGVLYKVRQGKNTTPGTYCVIDYSAGKVSYLSEFSSSGFLGNKCGITYESKKAFVRTAGNDDCFATNDDVLTTFLFDNYGKAVTEYVTINGENHIYAASSEGYTDNNFTSNPKKNNKVTITGSHGEYFKNIVNNGNLENADQWTSSLSYVGQSFSQNEFMFGSKSLCLTGQSSICSGSFTQNVVITEPGTYTLSAYIKSSMTMGFHYGTITNGAFVSFDGNRSEIISGATNENIRNGWKLVYVTKYISVPGTYSVSLSLLNMFGAAYFDGVSLIKSDSAASDFEYINDLEWVPLGSIEYLEDDSVKFSCDPNGYSRLTAVYPVNKPASKTAFSLSGWSFGYGAPLKNCGPYPSNSTGTGISKYWELSAEIYYAEGGVDAFTIPFNPDISGSWQYASGIITPSRENVDKTAIYIYLSIKYENNINYALFKDISLIEVDALSYEYNEQNGRIEKQRSFSGETSYNYDPDNNELLQSAVNQMGEEVEYTYVEGKHSVSSVTDSNNLVSTYSYNAGGLAVSSVTTPESGEDSISSYATYDNYGNTETLTDSLGHTASYGYDTNRRLLNYVTNANNHRTQYIYDLSGRIIGLYDDIDKDGIHDSNEAGASCVYDDRNCLTQISNGSTVYHFTYDDFGNILTVSIGSNATPLASYSYAAFNGKLMSTVYADGTTVSNTYDSFNRVKTVSYNGVLAYTVTYDGNGNISSYTDCATGRVYRYEYDALGRAIRFFVTLDGSELYESEIGYDMYGRSSGYIYSIDGVGTGATAYTYDQDNRLSQETTAGGDTVSYTYDGFGRVITKTTGNYSENYEYLKSGSNTSTIVSKVTVKYNGITVKTIQYTYDNLGNILTEDDGTTVREYTYDSLNQIKTEKYYDKITLNGEYRVYSISQNGNVNFHRFAIIGGNIYSVGVSGLVYGNGTDWKELLTSFANVQITYDANGNPLSYYNGQSYTFTWQKGRQLASSTVGSDVITYAYDISGLRISKTVNGTTHTYTYDGSMLLCDKWGNEYIEYFYDASGSPYALRYFNGTSYAKYYFVKNAEGDILELRNTANTLVATYIYDGWGKLVSVKDGSGNAITSQTHIANMNILRYRGYVYDTETKLYYLQSRYYDPQTQRFINPDSYVSTGQGIVGNNMFAYCNNNPANMIDLLGENGILVHEQSSAKGFGHTGLIVQDKDGTWYYYYWGAKGSKFTFWSCFNFAVPNDGKLTPLIVLDESLLHSTSGIKQVLQENDFSGDRVDNLTDSFYFYGDYSETYDYCETAIREGYKYKLYRYNCMQSSVKAMAKSNRDFLRIVDKSKLDCIPNHMLSEVIFLWGRQRTSTFLRLKNIEKLTELTFKKRIW